MLVHGEGREGQADGSFGRVKGVMSIRHVGMTKLYRSQV